LTCRRSTNDASSLSHDSLKQNKTKSLRQSRQYLKKEKYWNSSQQNKQKIAHFKEQIKW
jgi:hypothetical protein